MRGFRWYFTGHVGFGIEYARASAGALGGAGGGAVGVHGAAASVVFRVCVLLVRAAGYPPVAVVMGLSVLTVLVVAFGFGLPRVDPDGPRLWRLLYSLDSRESVVPLVLGGGLLFAGLLPGREAWAMGLTPPTGQPSPAEPGR